MSNINHTTAHDMAAVLRALNHPPMPQAIRLSLPDLLLSVDDKGEKISIKASLILYGPQGAGKTRLFRNLNPRPEYYCGEELNVSNKKEAANVTIAWAPTRMAAARTWRSSGSGSVRPSIKDSNPVTMQSTTAFFISSRVRWRASGFSSGRCS